MKHSSILVFFAVYGIGVIADPQPNILVPRQASKALAPAPAPTPTPSSPSEAISTSSELAEATPAPSDPAEAQPTPPGPSTDTPTPSDPFAATPTSAQNSTALIYPVCVGPRYRGCYNCRCENGEITGCESQTARNLYIGGAGNQPNTGGSCKNIHLGGGCACQTDSSAAWLICAQTTTLHENMKAFTDYLLAKQT